MCVVLSLLWLSVGANVIKFRPFTNWAHNEEWMVTLPESEGVLLVAAGEYAQWGGGFTPSDRRGSKGTGVD